jgi:hypothetical protein
MYHRFDGIKFILLQKKNSIGFQRNNFDLELKYMLDKKSIVKKLNKTESYSNSTSQNKDVLF